MRPGFIPVTRPGGFVPHEQLQQADMEPTKDGHGVEGELGHVDRIVRGDEPGCDFRAHAIGLVLLFRISHDTYATEAAGPGSAPGDVLRGIAWLPVGVVPAAALAPGWHAEHVVVGSHCPAR